MTRTEYTWKVITMLSHAASIAAGIIPDDLKCGLSLEKAERLEDELRAGYTVGFASDDTVTNAAYQKARSIKDRYFPNVRF